jgi:phage host-nuclease inhibitor protein Gam
MSNVETLIATAEKYGPPELPEEIATYEDTQDPEVKGAWQITTQTSADWALARVAECEVEADAIDAQYAAAVERLAKRRDALKERAARGQRYFEFKLAEWANANRKTLLKGKKKSVQLLHGSVGWRQSGGRLVVTNRDEFVAWLQTQPIESGLVRIKYEPDMTEIQALCKRDGIVPPGTEWAPEVDNFYVRVEAPEMALVKGETP